MWTHNHVMQVGLHETLTMVVNGVADLCSAIEADFFPAIDAVVPIGRRVASGSPGAVVASPSA